MPRTFKTVDYEATLDQKVSLRECLPAEHLARFIAKVIAELDLSAIYAGYGRRGGSAIAPEALLGLLFYGYANGVFSSRKLELEPYIATGRQSHYRSWKGWLAALADPPAADASPKLKMAYKLKTDEGQAFYRLRKCTVEPVIGIIKEAMGLR